MKPEMKPVKQGNKPSKPEAKPTKPESKPAFGSAVDRARARSLDDDDLDSAEFDELEGDFEVTAPAIVPPDAKPSPVELPAPINPEGGRKQSVELHRNLFCLHYDNCLDEAVKRGWNSFTCVRCAFYHSGKEEKEGGGVERFATQRRVS